jgi:hypothetical protein
VSFHEKKTEVKSLLALFLSKGQCHQDFLNKTADTYMPEAYIEVREVVEP